MSPELLALVVSDKCAEIVTLLAKTAGTFVDCQTITTWVYRHEPNGGPMNAAACINQIISYNRPKMAAMGWKIESRQGRYGGYKLSVHEAARAVKPQCPADLARMIKQADGVE